jgi:predicted dehydrogenase
VERYAWRNFDRRCIVIQQGGAATMPLDAIYQVDIRIFGSKGMLLLDIERPRLELFCENGRHQITGLDNGLRAYACVQPLHRFIDLIQGKPVENCSPASLGPDVVAILDATSLSATSCSVELTH